MYEHECAASICDYGIAKKRKEIRNTIPLHRTAPEKNVTFVGKYNPHTQNQAKKAKEMFLFRDVLVFVFFFFVSCKIHQINMEKCQVTRYETVPYIGENILYQTEIF